MELQATSLQAYTGQAYRSLLEAHGFDNIAFYKSFGDYKDADFIVVVARKDAVASSPFRA